MKKRKLKKYATGTTIKNYMIDPATALAQNDINIAKAMSEAQNNPWVKGLEVGSAVLGTFGEAISGGINNIGPKNVVDPITKPIVSQTMAQDLGMKEIQLAQPQTPDMFPYSFAFGGKVPNVPVEVEGEEVAETPNNELLEFQGNSHEQGGIETVLPEGTEMYSKRIKVDGVSMADRKKGREKRTATLEDLLKNNAQDVLLKNTLKRTQETNLKEEEFDTNIQALITQLLETQEGNPNQEIQKHAWGDVVEGTKNFLAGVQEDPNVTLGNALTLAGGIHSTFNAKRNTLANRAGDTPNINAYENFGQDALDTMDETKTIAEGLKKEELLNFQKTRNATQKRLRNTSRGVNTARAFDITADRNLNDIESKVYAKHDTRLLDILSNEANLENQRDLRVMAGEQARDLADRQDRDSFYTQLGEDEMSIGEGLQQLGLDFNTMKENTEMMSLLNQLSEHGYTYDPKTKKIVKE